METVKKPRVKRVKEWTYEEVSNHLILKEIKREKEARIYLNPMLENNLIPGLAKWWNNNMYNIPNLCHLYEVEYKKYLKEQHQNR